MYPRWMSVLISFTRSLSTVQSLPLTAFDMISAVIFVVLLFSVREHNHSIYEDQYAEWDRPFICQRCGAISQ
jgi:hypothetical protein